MKKNLAIMAVLAAVSVSVQGQGLVNFVNSAAAGSKISVNSVVGGAATALAPATANGFYYALFSSSAATTVSGSSAAVAPTSSVLGNYVFSDTNNWTFSGSYATNSTAGRVLGNSSSSGPGAVVNGVAGGGFAQFVVIGWSANLGSTLAQMEASLASGNFVGTGYIGESAVSPSVQVGDGVSVSNPSIIAASGAVTGFTLGIIPVPEPGTMALAGLGGLSLLAFRRKK